MRSIGGCSHKYIWLIYDTRHLKLPSGWAWYHHHFHYHPPLGWRSMAQARWHRLDGTGSKAQARWPGSMAQARRHRPVGTGTMTRAQAWVYVSNRTTQLKSSINIAVSASSEWRYIYPFCTKRVTHQLNLPQPTRSMSCLKCLCNLNARSKHRRG